jgi:hypothetical protein
LVSEGLAPPKNARVVLVHALDPAAFAGTQGDPTWPSAMLSVVASEELSRVHHLAVLGLEKGADLTPALYGSLPKAQITILPSAPTTLRARSAITAFLNE